MSAPHLLSAFAQASFYEGSGLHGNYRRPSIGSGQISIVSSSSIMLRAELVRLIGKGEFITREGREAATYWLPRLEGQTQGTKWIMPHLSLSEEGEPTFEWWSGTKKLIVYFPGYRPILLRVWGSKIDTEMAEVELIEPLDFVNHWRWLWS